MLIKELKKYLLSECANCACHLNTEDRVPEPTKIIPESNLTENNFNINAISYIYKIPPEELIANVRSHTIKQSDESSKQFDDLTSDECLQMNFAFCKTCTPMFGEIYRSHKIFHLWSSVGNLIFKAIQLDNRFKKQNAIEDTTRNSEICIKSENDNNECGSIEENENWDNHNFVYVNPTNQYYENICEDEAQTNDPLCDEIKCEVFQIDLENNHDYSNSSSQLAGNKTYEDCDDTSISDTQQTVCIKLEESEEQESSSQSQNTLHTEIANDTYNLFIKGPPFDCPRCTKMPPFQYINGLRLHCKVDHQLIIPDSAFSEEALTRGDFQFKTHPTVIQGPPYQCPTCVESFQYRAIFDTHCKTVHRLLIPRQRNFSCCFCKKEFSQITSWQYHCRIEHNCGLLCWLCKMGFRTNNELQLHFKTDCHPNESLRKAIRTKSSSVAETEEHSIVQDYQTDHIIGKIVANTAHRGNTKSVSNVKMKVDEQKFLYFPENKSKNPPFVCPQFGCNERFSYMTVFKYHCLAMHKLILKVINPQMKTYYCDECPACAYGQEEFTEHMKATHYEKFVSSQRPSEDSNVNPLDDKITIDINNLFIEGPPFHCPGCTKMPPFKYPNGLRLHCKVDHQLIIPDSAFSEEALKESDIQFKTHPTKIKGPPYQCPNCVEVFKIHDTFLNHCKNVHQLLIPRQRNSRTMAFSCCFCKKEFRLTSYWKNHCRMEHNCRFFCLECKMGFGNNNDLQVHFKTDCGANRSLRKEIPTNTPCVAETEECSIVQVNGDDNVDQSHHINDKVVTNTSHPGNTESDSNVSFSSNKFLFFPTKKSKTPPFLCPKFGCGHKFSQMPLLEDHCLDVHKLILKVKNTQLRTFFCDECTECVYGKEEFKLHLKSAHYEKFVSCQRPSEDSIDPSAVCEKWRLKCNECGLTFQHYNLLQQHSVESHSITLESYEQRFFNFICRGCDTLFETSFGLRVHTRQCGKKNKDEKVFGCKYCSATFNAIKELTTHLENEHEIKTSNPILKSDPKIPKCLFCLKVFNSFRDLQYHRLLIRESSDNSADNNESLSVTCQICKARFTTISGMKVHQFHMHRKEASHSIQGPYNCEVCCKSFTKKNNLNCHIKLTHMKLKKTCKICGEKFFNHSYIRHMRMAHTGYKPYKCNFCDKTFMANHERKDHQALIHSDVRPFVCSICGKGFKLRLQMKYHEKTHSTERGFLCPRCGPSFKSKSCYNIHMRCHKQDDLAGPNPKCSECNKTFSNGGKLRHHKRITHNKHGPLPCPICGKMFALKERVTYHMRAMHPESV